MVELDYRNPSFLRTMLGKLAFWVEATFGLYSDPEILRDQAPETDKDWNTELLVMYELLRKLSKEKSDGKYGIMFRGRVFLDIWAACGKKGNEKIPKTTKEAKKLINESFDISITVLGQGEEVGEIAYFEKQDTDLKVFESSFLRTVAPAWAYDLYMLLEFAVIKGRNR